MRAGDSCLYKLKGKCGAPSFKISNGYQNYFNVQYLEFNIDDVKQNYEIPFNKKLRESWPSDYPLKKVTSPRQGDPVRSQIFSLDDDKANLITNINGLTDY